ncbi:hypothetical protein ABSL23_02295 [Halobacterium sp. NMX12-1]|uniref:Uncharacterized protein n=1 Tax=Halobacterium sp. NMX12-1 TaxID=3166650 RepID=A0AAU8CFP5_9EURY
MAQSANIFLDEGQTGPGVEAQANDAGHESQVLSYKPDRGTAISILNAVAAGSSVGVPVAMKLRDTNGNLIPTNSTVYFAVKRAGQSSFHRISEEVTGLGHWHRTDLTTQLNTDNIDNSKVELQYPEASGKTGTPSNVTVRDIDEVAVMLVSQVEIDPAETVIQVDTDATEGPFSR